MSKSTSPHTFYRIYAISLVVMLCTSFLYDTSSASAQLFDARCHTKAECTKSRINMGVPTKDANKGFYTGTETKKCPSTGGQQQGYCAAGGIAKMGLEYSGRTKFANLGNLIQFAYQYGMIIAAILAVLMIIVSGIQWTVSGGNTSTISAAKKRITGAITGLTLLALAYTILNIINPAMVNLRLPQVWLVKQIAITPAFCRDSTEQNLQTYTSVAGKNKQDLNKILSKESVTTFLEKRTGAPASARKEDTACGTAYISQTSNTACRGLKCARPTDACNPATNKCEPMSITGTVEYVGTQGSEKANQKNLIDHKIQLVELCKNGKSKEVLTGDTPYENGQEIIKFTDNFTPGTYCGDKLKVLGYYFLADVDEEATLSAVDDWHAIGRVKDTKKFNINISKKIYADQGAPMDQICINDTKDLSCACYGVSIAGDEMGSPFWGKAKQSITPHLLQPSDFATPLVIEVELNRTEFPTLTYAGASEALFAGLGGTTTAVVAGASVWPIAIVTAAGAVVGSFVPADMFSSCVN